MALLEKMQGFVVHVVEAFVADQLYGSQTGPSAVTDMLCTSARNGVVTPPMVTEPPLDVMPF